MITDVAAGSECSNGGIKVQSGEDTNGDGQLNELEIKVVKFICDGLDATGLREIRLATGGYGITSSLGEYSYRLFDDFDLAAYPGFDSLVVSAINVRHFYECCGTAPPPSDFKLTVGLVRFEGNVAVPVEGAQFDLAIQQKRQNSPNAIKKIPVGKVDLGFSMKTNTAGSGADATISIILYASH